MPFYTNTKIDGTDYIEASDLEAIESGFSQVDAAKSNKKVPAAAGNLATLDVGGDLGDSGKAVPSGSIVGTTDAQTLTNKTFVTPALGTPASGTLTNCSGLPPAGVSGTALVVSNIGTTVQAYDADTAKYDATTANFTGTLQNGGSNVLVDADIGVSVQPYDATILVDTDIGVNVQAYDATILVDADIGVSVQPYDATILVDADIGVNVQAYDATIVVDADIGVSVQAYDADTAKTDVAQTFTASQYGEIASTLGTLTINVSARNNYVCTPSSGGTLTFSGHTSGASGLILFTNTSDYAITAAATTYISAADLTKLSTTGTYLIAYLDNGTNTYCTVTAALTSAGA